MKIPRRLQEKADEVIATPIRNATALGIFACILACIALIFAVRR